MEEGKQGGRKFVIEKRVSYGDFSWKLQLLPWKCSGSCNCCHGNLFQSHPAPTDPSRPPTQEEIEVMKAAALSVRLKPLGTEGLGKERLKRKAEELWREIVRLETERFDLEEVRRRQEYDVRM